MKKLLKITGIVFAILVLAIAAFVFTFDANHYKPQIIEQVEQHTGRSFEIKDDIGLSVFPWIGLEIGAVRLGNAPGFSQSAFAKIDRLDVKVKLLPLLKKQIEVDKIKLHGLTVSLEVDQQGNNNWSGLGGPAAEQPAETETAPEQQTEPAAASALAGLAINGLEFANANFSYSDAKAGTKAKLSNFNLDAGAIRFNQPVPIKLSANVVSNQPELKADITVKSQIRFNETFDEYDINNLLININTNMPDIASDAIAVQLGLDAHVDMKLQAAKLNKFSLGVFGVELQGAFDVDNMLETTPRIKGSIHSNDFDARAVAARLGIELPPMASAGSLTRVSLATLVDTDTRKIFLDDFILKLDASTLSGWIHVLDATLPAVHYSLTMTAIDLDGYLPPKAETAPVPVTETAASEADVEITLPVEMLRKLDLDGKFELDSARMQDIKIEKLIINTKAQEGVIDVKPVTFNTLNGSIDASAQVDVRKQQKFALTLNADNLEAGEVVDPMLQGLLGEQKLSLQGAVKLAADITTSGDKLSALKKNAKGTVQFDMNETAVQGIDIDFFVRGLVADYLTEKSIPVEDDFRGSYVPEQKTAFKRVHATANIANGVVRNDDLVLDSSRVMITGKGAANIIDNTVDYRVTVDLNPPRVKTLVEKALDQPLDVHVHGPFAQPAIDPDISKMRNAVTNIIKAEAKAKVKQKTDEAKQKARQAAEQKKREAQQKLEQEKAAAQQKLEQEKEEARKKLEEKAKDKLKGLFGR